LTATEANLLSQGSLHAAVEPGITPQEVLGSGQPRFDLLARDLLAGDALARRLDRPASYPPCPVSLMTSRLATSASTLAEQRIHQALQPILGRRQRNLTPEPDEAQTARREIYRVLETAFRARRGLCRLRLHLRRLHLPGNGAATTENQDLVEWEIKSPRRVPDGAIAQTATSCLVAQPRSVF